mmetsp:Transcript_13340/g.43489  ORF Transcript_13340/g.43489 Transcript_13340/m.43489 type:complete len:556 (-) Transcript_13340:21-1688(-)
MATSEINVNDEEESDEEPEIEVVADEEATAVKKRKRLKVYVVFHGDRASRRLPHSVRVKCPRDGSWESGAEGVAKLTRAFVERYDETHPRTPLAGSEAYLVNDRGVAVAEGDELRLYAPNEGVLHFLLGANPKGAPTVVLQWGYSPTETSDAVAPGPVVSLARKRVASIAAGWLHCCAVLESGKAVAFGSNDFGQLGTGDEKKSKEPVLCALAYEFDDVRLCSVACGSYFTCCLDDKGDLYTWGRYQASNSPTKFADTWVNGYAKRGETGIRGEKVSVVAAGECHTLVYCEATSTLYSWGYNEQWQLGWGQNDSDRQGQQKPRKVVLPAGASHPLRSTSCGGQHSCVVDAKGTLYGWGSNYEGQIGHVVRSCFGAPEAVTSMEHEDCVAVHCGRYATLAITKGGNAFFWGSLAGSANQQSGSAVDKSTKEEKAGDDDAARKEDLAMPNLHHGGGATRMLAGAAKQLVASNVKVGAVGEAHGILQTKGNDLKGWGYNAYGQALGKVDPQTDVIEDARLVALPPDLYSSATSTLLDVAVAGGTTTLLLAPPAQPSAE